MLTSTCVGFSARSSSRVKPLVPPELRDPPDHLPRMDAEAGTADQRLGESEGDQQFGQAGHQRDDARLPE
jgi:hypothetical protein